MSLFAKDVTFAVRSSATSEDLVDQSFAGMLRIVLKNLFFLHLFTTKKKCTGQHQTILNVSNNVATISSALLSCWASIFNDGALLYRLSYKRQHKNLYDLNPHLMQDLLVPQMAVVVQVMIRSVSSGVMFTADVTTSNRRRVIIEAAYGLGETIVSGKVKPDKYTFDKTSKKIIDKKIQEKSVAVVCSGGEGTVDSVIESSEDRMKQVLSEDQITDIVHCGLQLEELFQSPQDVEFAYNSSGVLCLLQSRAITSLFPAPVPLTPCFNTTQSVPVDMFENVYVSASHIQVMTDPMSYFGLSLLLLWGNWMLGATRDIPHRIVTPANRLYMSFSDLWGVKSIGAKFAAGLSAIDAWISKSYV